MDHLAAKRGHPLNGGSEVGDQEVGERETVTKTRAALVQPERNPLVLSLPAAPLLGSAALQRRLQQLLPEASRAFRLVGGKLDQEPRHQRSHRTGNPVGCVNPLSCCSGVFVDESAQASLPE